MTEAARGAPAILAEPFVNAGAIADELGSGAYGERVTVTGCGWEGRRASKDESAAGAIYNASVKGALVSTGARNTSWGCTARAPRVYSAATAPPGASRYLATRGTWISALPSVPCWSYPASKGTPSPAGKHTSRGRNIAWALA